MIFWLNRGFDGVRIDSARYLVEDGPGLAADRPGTHEYFREVRKQVMDPLAAKGYAKMMVGEVWTDDRTIRSYFGNGEDELNMAFDFNLPGPVKYLINNASMTSKIIDRFDKDIQNKTKLPGSAAYGTILNNHDNLMSRPATTFKNEPDKIKMAAIINLMIPGTPFIYYGNELGMTDGRGSNEFRLRMPTAWDDLGRLDKDPDSIFSVYRNLVRVRNQNIAVRRGDYERVMADHDRVYAFIRKLDQNKVLTVLNLDDKPADTVLDLSAYNPSKLSIQLAGKGVKLSGKSRLTVNFNKGMDYLVLLIE
jgi:alpha-glucosidase